MNGTSRPHSRYCQYISVIIGFHSRVRSGYAHPLDRPASFKSAFLLLHHSQIVGLDCVALKAREHREADRQTRRHTGGHVPPAGDRDSLNPMLVWVHRRRAPIRNRRHVSLEAVRGWCHLRGPDRTVE